MLPIMAALLFERLMISLKPSGNSWRAFAKTITVSLVEIPVQIDREY